MSVSLARQRPGRKSLALFALMAMLWGTPAFAVCPGASVLIEDQFEILAPVWGEASSKIKVEGGQLVLTAASGTYTWAINNSTLLDDIDMCVNVTTQTAADATDAFGGAVFWYQDVNNFYVFELAPNGRASVWRRQRGKWLEQVGWKSAENANEGEGASNELRVTTVGSDATLFVNGTEFARIEGSPPEEGQQIGLFAGASDDAEAVFAYDGLRVTRP